MLSELVSTWSPPPHPGNRSNTRSTAHKYATAVDQPCFHSFASSWPSGSGALSAAMLLTDFFNNSSKARTHSSREGLYSRTTTGAAFRPLPLIASSPNLFERLKTCRSGTHPHRSQKGYIELGVNAAVIVAAGRWDAAAPLQRPDVLGRTPEKSGRFADVNYAVHHRRA
jgi:hypothetical protein